MEVESEELYLGGEAANTAHALIHWSHKVLLAGNDLGSGPYADRLWDLIRAGKLPTYLLKNPTAVSKTPSLAPLCDIYVTPDGERTMFGLGFSTAVPGIPVAEIPLTGGSWFTAEPNMAEASRELSLFAARAGMRVYLMDFVRDDEQIPPGSFWQSSTDLIGHRNNMQRNVQWVKAWVARHGCHTILSDGPNGFVYGGPGRPARAYPPFPAPSVVDTTGAGDLFRAGMLLGLDSGWEIGECLKFASAAGCLKCRAIGATSDVPTRAEISEHISQNPDVAAAYGQA